MVPIRIALVGSCAQVGRNCHISAASQIGGVLEPVGALPVIIEDNVLIGGNCGVYEADASSNAAPCAGNRDDPQRRSTPVYDLARNEVYRATEEHPLVA